MYNITRTEKGILIHDKFFICDWDGFMNRYGKINAPAPTNLGELKLEAIQMKKMQIAPDPDPDDVFFIMEDVIFSLNNNEFYYYRSWTDLSLSYYHDSIRRGYKLAQLPDIKKGGFIGNSGDFELLPCQPEYIQPMFITD